MTQPKRSYRARSLLLVAVTALVLPAMLAMLPVGMAREGPPGWCEQHPEDVRCDPQHCQRDPNDPWCWDPNYCERNPDDVWCHKEMPQNPKATCGWSMTAAPPVAGASPGPAVVSLKCPNHILGGWKCGWKDERSPLPIDPTPSTSTCTYHGEQASTGGPCDKTQTWSVARPDVRTVTAWLRADMWKDLNCDGVPDDWNTRLADGTCKIPNWYSPKMPSPPPVAPNAPDGIVDECDMQHYELQWRQFN